MFVSHYGGWQETKWRAAAIEKLYPAKKRITTWPCLMLLSALLVSTDVVGDGPS